MAIATHERPARAKARHPALRLWWLSPIAVTLFVAIAAIVPTILVPDQAFRTLWRTPKSITTETLLLFSAGALALSFGALVAIALTSNARALTRPWPDLSDTAVQLLRKASTFLTMLTVAGYLGFVVLIAKAGLSLAEMFPFASSGSDDATAPSRELIGTIPGVTTLTQLGMAAVIVSAILLAHEYSRTELAKLLAIVGFAVPRAYLFSERLAILELLVPIGLIAAARLSTGRGMRRIAAQLMPPVGLFSVVVIFGTFEYFRSWTFYRLHSSQSFLDFTLSRFAGYYTTALNNGQLILDHMSWPGRLPYDTIEGFWTTPGIEQLALYERLGGHERPYPRDMSNALYFDVLGHFGNQEFNNPSGYAGIFVDYGSFGGIVFCLAAGCLTGYLYSRFCQAKPIGLMLYPMLFIGLVELPHYVYWGQGRATYSWLALIVIAVMLARSEAKARRAGVG